ncbi:MAG: DUF4412 domain-containing protein [Methylacidiphilales bacterium]|nr:DUF4412 domain-containing protein [Candidatus Methylacidiphilales bacterium]
MKRLSSLVLLVLVSCSLTFLPSRAQELPFGPAARYSADQVITTKSGTTVTGKINADSGKYRMEMNTHGMDFITIIRPDQQKVYNVMPTQQLVMEMPYNPDKMKRQMPTSAADGGKIDLVGPDVVDGAACLKYKITNKDGKVFYLWSDAVKKFPVKMAADDNSFTALWKNYTPGPQDPTLFEPPTGYRTMSLPLMPGGNPGAGGGQ